MIKPFKNPDYFKLIEEMNKFEETTKVFATNIFPPIIPNSYWYGASFYNASNNESIIPQYNKKENQSTNNPSKIIPPTKSQLDFLKKNNWTGELPKTKSEAWHIINSYKTNLKEENI